MFYEVDPKIQYVSVRLVVMLSNDTANKLLCQVSRLRDEPIRHRARDRALICKHYPAVEVVGIKNVEPQARNASPRCTVNHRKKGVVDVFDNKPIGLAIVKVIAYCSKQNGGGG